MHSVMSLLSFESSAALELFTEQVLSLLPNAIFLLYDQEQQLVWFRQLQETENLFSPEVLSGNFQSHQQQMITLHDVKQRAQRFLHQQKIILLQQQPQHLHLLIPLNPVEHPSNTPSKQELTTLDALAVRFHSHSSKMRHMFSIIQRVAVTEFPVLVRGESGSGKELVAKTIHDFSLRKDQVFIAINCAALNANILESELFGHVKGAFTGAIRDHKGVFEQAAGGTLFLDEIAEIPLELQAKLLRVLETGEFTPLGGEKSIRANVRIITATHRALREEARQGRFRQDLLYRLRVIPIFIPPLRERKEDIPLITQVILSENTIIGSEPHPEISAAAMQSLLAYDWPGNVRELKNTLLYALTMAHGKRIIEIEDLPQEILEHISTTHEPSPSPTETEIHSALLRHQHDLKRAADELGISRTTLWRYRKKFKL